MYCIWGNKSSKNREKIQVTTPLEKHAISKNFVKKEQYKIITATQKETPTPNYIIVYVVVG